MGLTPGRVAIKWYDYLGDCLRTGILSQYIIIINRQGQLSLPSLRSK